MARSTTQSPSPRMMVERVGYGAVAVILVVALAAADAGIARAAGSLDGPIGRLLQKGSVLPLLIVFLLFCGCWELEQLLAVKGARPHIKFIRVALIGLVATPWLSAAGLLGPEGHPSTGFPIQIAWLAAAILGTGALTVARRDPAGAFRDMGATLIEIVYLGFLASFAIHIRCSVSAHPQDGAWLLLIVLLVTKASDIGGYFVGSALGRHKLIPAISPGKSVEGTLGGLAASAAVAMAFALVPITAQILAAAPAASVTPPSEGIAGDGIGTVGTDPPLWHYALFGVFLGAAGQLGDFVESCFKRDVGSKDSGKILPQFGGILDLIDSPVLAMPVAWFFLTLGQGRW